jgi:hypothetical protein
MTAEAGHDPSSYIDQQGALHLGNSKVWDSGEVDVTATFGGVGAAVGAVGASYRLARGKLTTATAVDTVVTGLTTVVAIVATLQSNPIDDPQWVSATIGNQAGAPAAGSVIIKTWQNTSGSDPSPLAASTFSKIINWLAVGT